MCQRPCRSRACAEGMRPRARKAGNEAKTVCGSTSTSTSTGTGTSTSTGSLEYISLERSPLKDTCITNNM